MKTPNDSSDVSPDERATRSIDDAPSTVGAAVPPVGIGTVLEGKYRIDEVLGTGGMGTVFAALHLHLGQRVALKFLTSSRSPNDERRFRREARIAFALRSEHVARVLDVGTDANGSRYLVMEHLIGETLRQRVGRLGPVSIREASDLVLQACEGIAEAHAVGIVHRDLKLANLMLSTRPDGSPLLKVLDFGIAKLLGEPDASALASQSKEVATAPTSILGSLLYMSPEQLVSSRDVDQRTDIWALGVVLHELVVGAVPFAGRNAKEMKDAISSGFDPTKLRARAPEAWVTVVARCLTVARADRWSSVADLADALAPFASDEAKLHITRARSSLGRSAASRDSPLTATKLSSPAKMSVVATTAIALGAIAVLAAIAALAYPLVMAEETATHASRNRQTRGATNRGEGDRTSASGSMTAASGLAPSAPVNTPSDASRAVVCCSHAGIRDTDSLCSRRSCPCGVGASRQLVARGRARPTGKRIPRPLRRVRRRHLERMGRPRAHPPLRPT